MDRHIHWLREFVIRTVLVRVAIVAAAVTAALQVILVLSSSHAVLSTLPWTILAGEATAVGLIALAITTNPLNRKFLRTFADAPVQLVASVGPDEMHANAAELQQWQLRPVVVVTDPDNEAGMAFDLLQPANQLVTAAVNRATGSVALMSRLSDGRILHTTDLIVPPSESLVVNTQHGAGPGGLVSAHRAMMKQLVAGGVNPVPNGATLFAAAQAAEHAGYGELGSVVGSFLNVDANPSYFRLLVRPDPRRVLELSRHHRVRSEERQEHGHRSSGSPGIAESNPLAMAHS